MTAPVQELQPARRPRRKLDPHRRRTENVAGWFTPAEKAALAKRRDELGIKSDSNYLRRLALEDLARSGAQVEIPPRQDTLPFS